MKTINEAAQTASNSKKDGYVYGNRENASRILVCEFYDNDSESDIIKRAEKNINNASRNGSPVISFEIELD